MLVTLVTMELARARGILDKYDVMWGDLMLFGPRLETGAAHSFISSWGEGANLCNLNLL